MGVLVIVAYAVVYGLAHSWLAAERVKAGVQRRLGPAARWYRLLYNGIATLTLLPLVPLLALLPDDMLYTIPLPWLWLALAGQALGLAGIAYGVWTTDLLHFLGLRQLIAATDNAPPRLVVRGLYRWVRHPLYFFGLLVLWLTPQMTVNRLALFAVLSLYMYIGTFFEERRLIREFGAAYRAYQQRVPRLLPFARPGSAPSTSYSREG